MTEKRLTVRQKAFLESDEAMKARIQLKLMVNDPAYNTRETYSVGVTSQQSFVDKHMLYLSQHPKMSIQHYLSNLRLKSKIRI